MSWNGPLLISAATRLQGIFFWDLAIWLIEGVLFLLMGFEVRVLMEKAKAVPINEVLVAIALTSAIVIAARFIWVFPGDLSPAPPQLARPARRSAAAMETDRRHRFHRHSRRRYRSQSPSPCR